MKVELIVRRVGDIVDSLRDLSALQTTHYIGPTLKREVREDVFWIDNPRITSGSHAQRPVFSFDAKNLHELQRGLMYLLPHVDRLAVSRDRPEYQIRVNGVLLEKFYSNIASHLNEAVEIVILLLDDRRGRKPSRTERRMRKILEAKLPQNQEWLKGK